MGEYGLDHEAHYKNQQWALVNTVMNLRVPQNAGILLTRWETGRV